MDLEQKKNTSEYEEDDGRTIADMNVEGMPWYVKGDKDRADLRKEGAHAQMTDEEARMYKWAAVKAALLVVLVFGLVFFLFIAFCDFVWFR